VWFQLFRSERHGLATCTDELKPHDSKLRASLEG
jgi:hypothetical protein